ncbi:MAG: BTAD domain-containing putative transcriptional regulator [Gaiellaceae bacterium]
MDQSLSNGVPRGDNRTIIPEVTAAAGAGTEFRILGQFEVTQGGEAVALSGTRKALLAALLLRANEPVTIDQLIEDVWGEQPPASALKMVRNAIWALRKLLEKDALATRPGGYELQLEPGRLDAERFERLAQAGSEALACGAPAEAADRLREALGLWRGRALADFAYSPFAHPSIARLEELRLNALEDRIEADIELRRHSDLVGELEQLVAEQPLRERLRAQQMVALYRSGRQAEALGAFQQARRLLVDELGLEPSPSLRRLEQSILRHDPELEPPADRVEQVAPAELPETRRGVVILFVLVSPQDGTDAEARRRVLAAASEAAAAVLERHGAEAEPLQSGAMMGVFGVPAAHEDDPLRALRAAAELAAASGPPLEADIALGLDAGEVIVGKTDGRPTVDGEVVASAASLAQAARPGEVLVGTGAEQLLRGAARLERRSGVWRLVDLVAGAPAIARRFDTPLVGRERELELLRERFERCVQDGAAHLFTVLGPPGIGKSKLARELAASLEGEARVLHGRCLPYGDGVTFWPLREILRAAVGDDTGAGVARLLAGEPDAKAVCDHLTAAVGGEGSAGGSREETFRAARRLLETLARERPLVLVLEDLHWAEPTFLELVDHVLDLVRDVPILLLCLARPELVERRPLWAGGRSRVASILLEPLGNRDAERLIDNLEGGRTLEPDARARIVEAAEGNALFVEQMLALLAEGGAETAVPPSLQALLASRLDRLPPAERRLLDRAAVAGRHFSHEDVLALAPEEERADAGAMLGALARRELIRAERGEGDFRFVHGLVREAVYESVPKHSRARLHERCAALLERRESGMELDELVGYHLEQSHRYLEELGTVGARAAELAARAASRLGRAGTRASARGDVAAAVGLLTRAVALLGPTARERVALLAELVEALRESGDFPRAELVLGELTAAAAEQGDRVLRAYAVVSRHRLRLKTSAGPDAESFEREALDAVAAFEEADDDRLLAKAWELLAVESWFHCRAGDAERALAKAIEHARRAGDGGTEAQSVGLSIGAAVFGPLPVPDGLRRCDAILAEPPGQRRVAAAALRALAALSAMQGGFDTARDALAQARAMLEDLGLALAAAQAAETAGTIELLAGDPVAAEEELRAGYDRLERMGVASTRANLAALLATALSAQGRDREGLLMSEVAEQAAAAVDLSAQVHWQAARTRALAGLGRPEEALRFGHSAVGLAERTDFLNVRGDALMALSQAEPGVVGRAVRLYERKGNIVAAAGARARIRGSVSARP